MPLIFLFFKGCNRKRENCGKFTNHGKHDSCKLIYPLIIQGHKIQPRVGNMFPYLYIFTHAYVQKYGSWT